MNIYRNSKIYYKSIAVFIICFFFSYIIVLADTHTSKGSGDWSAAGSWNPKGPPEATDNVIIASGHTIVLDVDFAANSNITNLSSG